MAGAIPQLPLAQAWFRAAAVGSAPPQDVQLQHDPFGSGDKAAVAASEFSCQVSCCRVEKQNQCTTRSFQAQGA